MRDTRAIARAEGRCQRVSVIAPNWLGDAVMSLPAISMLASAPGWSVSVLSSPYVARVFLNQPGVDDLCVDEHAGRARRVVNRTRVLRGSAPRVTVMFPPSFSSALPAWLARVPQRIGFQADGRGGLLTHGLPLPSREVHLVDSYVNLARAVIRDIGIDEGPPPTARLFVGDKDRESVWQRVGDVSSGGYVVIVPGAAFGPAKSWPAERYRALCAELARHTRVILSGSAGDRSVCEHIAQSVPGVRSLAGKTTLGEMFALVEGARAVVANDSGAPHVAAALGVPCVVLFGSTSPAWTAPRGEDVRVLQHKVHCNPCFRRTCPTQLECFNGIPVEDVRTAVLEALSHRARKPMPAGKGLG